MPIEWVALIWGTGVLVCLFHGVQWLRQIALALGVLAVLRIDSADDAAAKDAERLAGDELRRRVRGGRK